MKTKQKPLPRKVSTARAITVPPLIQRALANKPNAKAVFDKLPFSHRKEYVNWITAAKQPETISRRLEKMIPMLLEKARQKARLTS
jgi:uncharacterized protein YdeI (YjbR/CyaY-like superfamily)